MPLTTDKASGWSLASLLTLPLLAFLFVLAPSFLPLATRVLWRGAPHNHYLAFSRRARFPRNSSQFPFLFSFTSFFFLSSSIPGLPQVNTLCPGDSVLQTSRDIDAH